MWGKLQSFFHTRGRSQARVYLDYASATPVLPSAVEIITRTMGAMGNPGSIHKEGVEAAKLLNDARARIAHELGCKAREVIFTSGGTEANNLAILGYAKAIEIGIMQRSGLDKVWPNSPRSDLKGAQGLTSGNFSLSGTRWIVSSIEHPSVLECFAEIERRGGRVDFVDPDAQGIIRPENLKKLLRKETVFVSVGWANGEIGIIQPIAKIAEVIHAHELIGKTTVILHSDAGQAPLYHGAHVHTLGIDMLTLDSGKLYGPRGVAALYMSDRTALAPVQLGGSQERGLRAGTENTVLVVGFAESFAQIASERHSESKRLRAFRNELEELLTKNIPGIIINSDSERTLASILNVSIPRINSEYLMLALDNQGFAISTKSACREGESQKSHVVALLGGEEWRARNTVRISFGRGTQRQDVERFTRALVKFCESHRE